MKVFHRELEVPVLLHMNCNKILLKFKTWSFSTVRSGSYLRVEDKGMSQCDNMLVSGSCGISLLQQLRGIFKYVISCGCCSGSKMHFALQCLCSLIILACFPEECKQEQECWLRTIYISGKASRRFLGWRNGTFFVQELFSWLISWNCYKQWRCASQRKASYTLYMEFFSNEGLTRFAPLAIYLACFLSLEHKKRRTWVKCDLLEALPSSFLSFCLYEYTCTHTHFSCHHICKYIPVNITTPPM